MRDRKSIRDPHWWFYGGGALMAALFGLAIANKELWSNPAWKAATWLTGVMTGVGLLELLFLNAQRLIAWARGGTRIEPYLRPRTLAFARKLRGYYERFKDDPEMPRQFYARFYDDIYYYQGRLAAAGMKIEPWIVQREYIEGWMNETMVDVVICSIEVAAAGVAGDIFA